MHWLFDDIILVSKHLFVAIENRAASSSVCQNNLIVRSKYSIAERLKIAPTKSLSLVVLLRQIVASHR